MTTCVKSHKFVGSFTHQFCFVDSFIKFYTSETLFFFILCFLKKEEDSKPNRNLQELYDSFGIRRNPDPGLVVYASMRLTLFHPFDLFTLLTCNTLQMICTHQKPKLSFYLFSLSFLYQNICISIADNNIWLGNPHSTGVSHIRKFQQRSSPQKKIYQFCIQCASESIAEKEHVIKYMNQFLYISI